MEIDANSYDSEMLTLMKVKNQNWMIEKNVWQAHRMIIFIENMVISKIIKPIRRLYQNLKLLCVKKHNQQNEKVTYGIREMQVIYLTKD